MENTDVVINVDWFSLSGHLSVLNSAPFVPEGWKAMPMGRTAVWGQRWYIMNADGIKVGTFLMEPLSYIIKCDRAILEVSNQFLYRQDFHQILDILLVVFPFSVDGVQRIDLCGDFEMTRGRWEVTRMLESDECYLKGLKRGVGWWERQSRVRSPHQLSWGGKDSTFHWKLYNKHKELWEGGMCSKPYIEDSWRAAGLNPNVVWRLEVSICNVNGLDCTQFHVADYREWFDRAVDIYKSIYADKFVVRMNEGHRDARNDTRVTFLDFWAVKAVSHRKKKGAEMESDCERRIVCKLWKEYTDSEVRCNEFALEGLRQHLMYMFQKHSCVNAVCRRFKLSESQLLDEMNLPGFQNA